LPSTVSAASVRAIADKGRDAIVAMSMRFARRVRGVRAM
jgi:hypothetical protein